MTTQPVDSGGEEFDLDALIADIPIKPRYRFKIGGESFSLSPTLDIRVTLAVEQQDSTATLKLLLGEEQWARLMALKTDIPQEAMSTLLERYFVYTGASLGESSASSSSSVSTGGPSKRTSNGSTAPILVR